MKLGYCVVIALVLVVSEIACALRHVRTSSFLRKQHSRLIRAAAVDGGSDASFDPSSFEEALKKSGPVWENSIGSAVADKLESFKATQEAEAEQIYREYPFQNVSLPLLSGCNDYYSGKFEEYFWHQNADQLYVFIPVDDDLQRSEVKADFQAKEVSLYIRGELELSFECLDRIIPDGSFWVFERDQNGKKYIQLDLEKRLRMINWNSLFGKAQDAVKSDFGDNKTQMLQKLFSANKGMSKLTGMPPESIEEMMRNGQLTKMIADDLYDEGTTNVLDDEGNVVGELDDADLDDMLSGIVNDDEDDETTDDDAEGDYNNDNDDSSSAEEGSDVIDAEIVEG